MIRSQKKPLTEKEIREWIRYSYRNLAMAKKVCDRKGLD